MSLARTSLPVSKYGTVVIPESCLERKKRGKEGKVMKKIIPVIL
jgi:hypothetical protein